MVRKANDASQPFTWTFTQWSEPIIKPVVSICPGRQADTGDYRDHDAAAGELPHPGPEPTAGTPDTAVFTVTRNGDVTGNGVEDDADLASPLTVQFHPPAGTAISGTDYSGYTNSVTIPAGQASAEVILTAFADDLIEGDESIQLILKATDTYRLNNVTAYGSIKDGSINLDCYSNNDGTIDPENTCLLPKNWPA